jgi:hypothetical protein
MFVLRSVRALDIIQRGICFNDAVRDEVTHLNVPHMVSFKVQQYGKMKMRTIANKCIRTSRWYLFTPRRSRYRALKTRVPKLSSIV